MKKVLGIAFALLTLGLVVPAEARTADNSHENATVNASSAPQWQRDRYGRRYDRRYDRRYNRRSRTVTRSRLVRYGRRLYRETYVVRFYPNGRTDTRLISRTRVG
jgi:hypothetical protein